MSQTGVVVTQLVVDARGAQAGVADFEAAMAKAKAAAESTGQATGTSFDQAMRKWQNSLAATDPVLKAQLKMQQALEQQTLTGNRAIELGITTQAGLATQLEVVRQKHLALVDAAGKSKDGFLSFLGVEALLERSFIRLAALMAAREIIDFGVRVFESVAQLDNQAKVVGVSVEALQAYRAAAAEVGTSADDMDNAIKRFTKSMGDASTVVGPARTAFYDLHLTAADLAGGPEAALPRVAAALLAITDPTIRARDEVALFGKSGQEIEPVLKDLTANIGQLKEKFSDLIVAKDVADTAAEASAKMEKSWGQLKTALTPPIVWMVDSLNTIIELYEKWAPMAANVAAAIAGVPAPFLSGDKPNAPGTNNFGSPSTVYKPPAAANQNFGQAEFTQYLAQRQEEARLIGLSKDEQAAEREAIAESAEKQHLMTGSAADINRTYAEAVTILGAQGLADARNLGIQLEHGKAVANTKKTFSQYLDSLGQAAQVAGETVVQRDNELAIIKGAQIVQKQRGDTENQLVQTYAGALGILHDQGAADILREESLKRTNELSLQLTQQQDMLNVGLATDRDHRALALQIAKEELKVGRQLTDEEKGRLALQQATMDATNLRDYLAGLRDEVSLAGLAADERQRQSAVLQEMHATHGTLTADQANEITGIITARQETEKWRQVVDSITSDTEKFFDDALSKGKLSFADLFHSIEGSFAQMLARMAAQAIEQPIIVPIVQGFASSLGLSAQGLGGSASGGSPLGILSGASSVGSGLGFSIPGLTDAGNFISGGLNSIGGSLGFATQASTGFADIPGFFNSGSVFGASTLGDVFGGALSGAGIGGLAGSLLFGNKNDSGIGSGLGGAIGSIFGPLGSLAGGLLGGALGSLTGSSNQSSIANLTNGGQGYSITQTGSQQNTQLVTQAAQAVNQAVTALTQAGVTLTSNITGFGIGSQKDYIYTTGGGKQKLGSAGDANDVVNQVLNQMLATAQATDTDIQKVLQTYQGQGGITTSNLSKFLGDIGFAQSLKTIDVGAAAPLSQAGQALKAINDQVAKLTGQAQALGLDTASIEAAGNAAKQTLLDGYLSTLQALTPATQAVSQWQTAMDAVTAAEKNAIEAATALGSGLDDVQAAASGARAALAGTFNTQINDAILKITNPDMEAYNALLTAQAQRVKDATAAGADLNAVYQLNGLEQKQITDQIAQTNATSVLNGLSVSVSNLITQAGSASATAQNIANSWGGAASALTKSSMALLISSPGLSPSAAYTNARTQFDQLRGAALGGDVNSANDISSFASTFLKNSFAYNGSTATYAGDLNYVQNTLSDLTGFSKAQQSYAQMQADSAAQAVTLLQAIKDGIANQTVQYAAMFDDLNSEVGNLSAQIKQANLQARAA